jgi:hypothetical protein
MEVKDFPNYTIYKDGRVVNKYGHQLKNVLNRHNGYYTVCLRNNPIQKNPSIHRLLAQHYIPNPNNLPFVDHMDRNKRNNDLSNLRWASCLLNQQNTGKRKNNKSGHKNVSHRKERDTWIYNYRVMGKIIYKRTFKSKIDCLCYKFICLLRRNLN